MAAPGQLRPFAMLAREYHAETGATAKEIAAQIAHVLGTSVDEASVSRILSGATYPEEGGPIRATRSVRSRPRSRHLSTLRVRELRIAYWTEYRTIADIAARFHITRTYAGRVARGLARTDVPMPTIAARDRIARPFRRGTGPTGEKNGNAVLTWEQVKEIRTLYWNDEAEPAELAEQFETSRENAWMIANNWRWKIPEDMFDREYGSSRRSRRRAREAA